MQIDDFGFLCRARQTGRTLRHDRGEHDVFGGADARKIKRNIRPVQFVALTKNISFAFGNGNAQPFQRIQMQIDRAKTDIAATGIRYHGAVETR